MGLRIFNIRPYISTCKVPFPVALRCVMYYTNVVSHAAIIFVISRHTKLIYMLGLYI